jgi:hypothetical protein
MLSRVALVRTDVLEEHVASIIRVTGIGELGTLAVTSNRSTLRSCHPHGVGDIFIRTSVLIRVMRRNIPEDGALHSHRCENLKSYLALTYWAL